MLRVVFSCVSLAVLTASCGAFTSECPPPTSASSAASNAVDDGPPSRDGDGPSYAQRLCYVDGVSLRYHALDVPMRRGIELRAVRNATVRRDAACPGAIAGESFEFLAPRDRAFEILGATNGNFFGFTSTGTRSNGFLWSRGGDATTGAVLAPISDTTNTDMHGDRVVIADPDGLHELSIETAPCEPGACRARVAGDPRIPDGLYGDDALADAIVRAFPRASLAMQVVAALPSSESEAIAAGWACPSDLQSPTAWKCERQPATIVCGHTDGAVSLYAVEPARYVEMVRGLRDGGACRTTCASLYILDGGHSTQMWTREQERPGFRTRYARYRNDAAANHCPRYRPVDHYLVVGRRRLSP